MFCLFIYDDFAPVSSHFLHTCKDQKSEKKNKGLPFQSPKCSFVYLSPSRALLSKLYLHLFSPDSATLGNLSHSPWVHFPVKHPANYLCKIS